MARRMMPGAYAGICFDLDGVLIDSMPLHALAWQLAGKQFNIKISKRFIYEHEGESGSKTAQLLFAANKGRDFNFRRLLAMKETYFRGFSKQIKPFYSLAGCLELLRRRKIALGLVTGTSLKEVKRAVAAKTLKQFQVIVTGDQVKRGKPHPEPYQSAFKQLGLKPEQVIVVENALYGIQSARSAQAGHIVAFASSLPKRQLSAADWIGGSEASVSKHLKYITTSIDGCSTPK